MLRVLSRLGVSLAVVGATVGGLASPAFAPKYIFGALAYGGCELDAAEDARFEGEFTILGFSAAKGQLYVQAALSGDCKDGAFSIAATAEPGVYQFPVLSLNGHCEADSAVLEIRPGAAQVLSAKGDKFVLDLGGSTVAERWWDPADPAPVRAHVCAIVRLLDRQPYTRLAPVLNQLVLH